MSDDSDNCCSLSECAEPTFFKALGHDNRIRLVSELCDCCEGGKTVGELSECCDVDISTVSRHLSKLRDAGIVDSEKQQQSVRYFVRAEDVVDLLRSMADVIESRIESETEEVSRDK
jgi:ArsR family transcriptional regulator